MSSIARSMQAECVIVNTIYKIATGGLWRQALRTGILTGAPVDVADGFIHFSTADQVGETARKHFHGQTDLILAAIDIEALGSALRWEPSRGGALFPHLYGPMAIQAVRWTKPLACDASGSPIVPDLADESD